MQDWKQHSALKSYMDAVTTMAAFPMMDSSGCIESQRDGLLNLQYVTSAMSSIESTIESSDEAIGQLKRVLQFARHVPRYLSIQNEEAQFDILLPLRSWLLWSPVSLIQRAFNPGTIAVIAYQNAVAIVLESLFPKVGTAPFGCHSILPIEEATRISSDIQAHDSLQTESLLAMSLMDMPNRIAKDFQGQIPAMTRPSFSTAFEPDIVYAPSSYHSASPESSRRSHSRPYHEYTESSRRSHTRSYHEYTESSRRSHSRPYHEHTESSRRSHSRPYHEYNAFRELHY